MHTNAFEYESTQSVVNNYNKHFLTWRDRNDHTLSFTVQLLPNINGRGGWQ